MPPEVTLLLLSIPYDVEGTRAGIDPALQALAQAVAAFETRAAGIPQPPPGRERVAEVRALYTRLAELLQDVKRELEGGAHFPSNGDSVQEVARQLEAALQWLDEYEQAQTPQSPLPPVDRFIISALNYRDGIVPRLVVEVQVAEITDLVIAFGADARRFRRLYPTASPMLDDFETHLATFLAGVNAARAWADGASEQTLLDALKLLRAGSRAVMNPLAAMDAHVRIHARHSRVVAMEELMRCGLEAMPRDVSMSAGRRLVDLLEAFDASIGRGRSFPLAFALRGALSELEDAVGAVHAVLTAWRQRLLDGDLGGAPLEAMRADVERASDAHERLQAQISGLLERFGEAPQLLEVVGALGRAGDNPALAERARALTSGFLQRLHALQQELAEQATPEAFEMRTLLGQQAEALQVMSRVLDDHDEAHCRNGLHLLDEVLPLLSARQRDLRQASEDQRRERERVVSCMRCGVGNPATNRYCSGCNAMLPAQAPVETVYTDIVGGDEAALPGNLAELQRLYGQAEAGADLAGVMSDLEKIHGQMQQVLHQMREGFAAKGSANPEAAEYADAFVEHLAHLIEAIEVMYNGAEHGSLDYMARGLEAALQAGSGMQHVQEHMLKNAAT